MPELRNINWEVHEITSCVTVSPAYCMNILHDNYS